MRNIFTNKQSSANEFDWDMQNALIAHTPTHKWHFILNGWDVLYIINDQPNVKHNENKQIYLWT